MRGNLLRSHESSRSYEKMRASRKALLKMRKVTPTLEYELIKIALDDHILHRGHGDLEQVGVGGIGEVAVDFLLWVAVQGAELVHEVLGYLLPVCRVANEICEAVLLHGGVWKLLLEQIHLVEEKNQRRPGEPLRVGNRLPQHERFLHLVTILILHQALVVSGNGDKEKQAVDVLETVDPLLSFGSLSSNIEHSVRKGTEVEDGLGNTSRSQSGSEHILVGGDKVLREETVNVLKEAV